jgi:hypothetical protein
VHQTWLPNPFSGLYWLFTWSIPSDSPKKALYIAAYSNDALADQTSARTACADNCANNCSNQLLTMEKSGTHISSHNDPYREKPLQHWGWSLGRRCRCATRTLCCSLSLNSLHASTACPAMGHRQRVQGGIVHHIHNGLLRNNGRRLHTFTDVCINHSKQNWSIAIRKDKDPKPMKYVKTHHNK